MEMNILQKHNRQRHLPKKWHNCSQWLWAWSLVFQLANVYEFLDCILILGSLKEKRNKSKNERERERARYTADDQSWLPKLSTNPMSYWSKVLSSLKLISPFFFFYMPNRRNKSNHDSSVGIFCLERGGCWQKQILL